MGCCWFPRLCVLPHNYEAIITYSDSPIDKSSKEKLYRQLYDGIFLNTRKQKYWVEDKRNKNCFLICASGLEITWGQDRGSCKWYEEQTSDGLINVAELSEVCWLEVKGRFSITNLSPCVTYEVVYSIMLQDYAFGWEIPVELSLILSNGNKMRKEINLGEKQRGIWLRIPVGEFKTSLRNEGEIIFSLRECDDGNCIKRGLVIKGVIIQPKM